MKKPGSNPLAPLQNDRAVLGQGLALPLGESLMARANCFLLFLRCHWGSRHWAVVIILGREAVIDESRDSCSLEQWSSIRLSCSKTRC
jgi:hypothetical protein